MAQQALVVLVAGQDVDGVPEAGPAIGAAHSHAGGAQASGVDDQDIVKFSYQLELGAPATVQGRLVQYKSIHQ